MYVKNNQLGIIHAFPLFVIVAVVGIVIFLLISAFSPFKNGLFNTLYTKPISHAATGQNVVAMPVISYNVPAFASSSAASHPASLANNTGYDDEWVAGSMPAWLAYDLSSVPTT